MTAKIAGKLVPDKGLKNVNVMHNLAFRSKSGEKMAMISEGALIDRLTTVRF